jgi:hypothetical protein
MQLEIGCTGNPLNEDYATLGPLATEGWVKAVWEQASHYGYKVAFDYPTEELPRKNDCSLMSIFLERGKTGKELISLNRCRITHQAKHLSCLSTADGKFLDCTYLSPPLTKEHLSFHRFARKEPMKHHWTIWEQFWRAYCNRFLELPLALGEWHSPSHRIWPWFHDAERDVLYRQNYQELKVYIPLIKQTTRTGSLYIYLGEVNIIPTKVVPISISSITNDVVSVKGEGPSLPLLRTIRHTFWESLMSRGGVWMWDYIANRLSNPSWMKRALEQGMAILATDGSYSGMCGPHVCGAGWVIACRKSRKILSGSFYKFSSSANAYRGEMLGLVALHTLVLQVCRYYHLLSAKGKTICNSKSALKELSQRCRRIQPGVTQGDIFLTLRSIHQEMPGANLTYEWVKSHQDS